MILDMLLLLSSLVPGAVGLLKPDMSNALNPDQAFFSTDHQLHLLRSAPHAQSAHDAPAKLGHTLPNHDPHAHPNPTVLNWKHKPLPFTPESTSTRDDLHATTRLLVKPSWHVGDGPLPTIDEAMSSLAMDSVHLPPTPPHISPYLLAMDSVRGISGAPHLQHLQHPTNTSPHSKHVAGARHL